MKLFVAGLSTETNTFSPMPTGQSNFWVRRNDDAPADGAENPILKIIQERGGSVVQGLFASAAPAGVTVRTVYESLRDEILDDLRAALPVDAVVYDLHGAMVAGGAAMPYDDCKGDCWREPARPSGRTCRWARCWTRTCS